ncbi:hypothetical protein [Cellulomonas sp. PS-H5]|uniref:hypothetical protein n=1 Tax=Cellulomonas sp. PS-H5 TaxID=2820400 RepID=UPI001C4F8465|nr:hypothetical protein [Cellulomonas sp. PS-H5]MBW0254370.1 hypothetical protein [Cellulomonas sp. PS-H5]
MSTLTVSGDAVAEPVRTLRECRSMIRPDRTIPSISSCGSDQVIQAYVHAFQMIRQQDANAYTSWANLGDQLEAAVDSMTCVDAALAESFR